MICAIASETCLLSISRKRHGIWHGLASCCGYGRLYDVTNAHEKDHDCLRLILGDATRKAWLRFSSNLSRVSQCNRDG